MKISAIKKRTYQNMFFSRRLYVLNVEDIKQEFDNLIDGFKLDPELTHSEYYARAYISDIGYYAGLFSRRTNRENALEILKTEFKNHILHQISTHQLNDNPTYTYNDGDRVVTHSGGRFNVPEGALFIFFN